MLSVHAAGELTEKQKQDALAMLNYITVLTREINTSKNSRIFMEDSYSELINNTNLNAIKDQQTLHQFNTMLDTMESYRMLDVKRERLQYLYEQQQAKAVKSAIPNPIGLLSYARSYNPAQLIASIAYMAVDSVASYNAYKSEAEEKYLKDGWELDDEEAQKLHQIRKDTFGYMVEMVNDYDLSGNQVLTEESVDEFVKWKNSTSTVGRIRFLETSKATYESYGGYWLELAESYYKNGDYQKCINAVNTYESKNISIFRKDYELARILPMAIASANQVMPTSKYTEYAADKAEKIVENTKNDDWALRFFAAETIASLYPLSKNNNYINSAYEIAYDNVNNLIADQRTKNNTYLSKVKEKSMSKIEKGASDEDKKKYKKKKKQVDEYNDVLKENRKTELPPVNEPLLLNCNLLFALAEKKGITDKEKADIDALLHQDDERLFLSEDIDDSFWFSNKYADQKKDWNIAFGGTTMIIPAEHLSSGASISVSVQEPGKSAPVVFDKDWKVDKVKRGKEGDITTFEAAYTSSAAKKYKWIPGSTVTVEIKPNQNADVTCTFSYKTEGTKNAWYDYLKVWEGHKNNWYDYAKVWENSVKFVQAG